MTLDKKIIKDILDNSDLYQWSITVKQLKNKYSLVSWCKNSKPTQGSLTLPTEKLNENNDTIIDKYIIHKNLDITLKTNQGFLKFLQ